jgi:hypothetical protein
MVWCTTAQATCVRSVRSVSTDIHARTICSGMSFSILQRGKWMMADSVQTRARSSRGQRPRRRCFARRAQPAHRGPGQDAQTPDQHRDHGCCALIGRATCPTNSHTLRDDKDLLGDRRPPSSDIERRFWTRPMLMLKIPFLLSFDMLLCETASWRRHFVPSDGRQGSCSELPLAHHSE